jgi:hypothetical protein
MRVMTQTEFNALPVVDDIRQCPGNMDYSAVHSFGERCRFGEGCSFGEGCKAKSPCWSSVYPPPFKTTGRIYPTEDAREYWRARLGLESLTGCYSSIAKVVAPKLPEFLKREDWTPCERRILESWLPGARGEDA